MAVVQNSNGLVAINTTSTSMSANSFVNFFEGDGADLQTLYKKQPEVRTCVDFLARNIAQLPIKAFTRVSDVERTRISEGPLVDTLSNPAPGVTRTRWLMDLVADAAVFGNTYHLKVRSEGGRVALIRIPPGMVTIEGSWLRPEQFVVTGSAGTKKFPAEQVVHIRYGFNPDDPRLGLSPLETLRTVLAEQSAANKYREAYWKNAARMGGVIERPSGAPSWSDTARARFKADWDAHNSGVAASGRTAILEEGMQFKPSSFSARDSQYLESFQLTREVVATAYGIPIGLLGLGSFTYASLSEQHRQLYADCLAPWLVLIQEELELQLLPEFSVPAGTYLEIDVDAKLAGSLEERARIFQASVGGPYVTRNEARSKLNLPPVDGGDELIVPLNVITGGQASPQDSVPVERVVGEAARNDIETKAAPAGVRLYLRTRDKHAATITDVIERALKRQQAAVTSKLGAKASKGTKASVSQVYDRTRFRRELAADLKAAADDAALEFGNQIARRYDTQFTTAGMQNYLDAVSEGMADEFTKTLGSRLGDALDEDDVTTAVSDLFDSELGMAGMLALSLATTVGNTARNDAAEFGGAGQKTWVVTSGNPRSSHAAVNGTTVGFGETFSNGMRWPGDSQGPVDERANCSCMVEFS